MRIGNGPRLVIPRPGNPGRRGYWFHYVDRGEAYDEWRALRLRTLRVAHRSVMAGDVKPQAVPLSNLKPGEHYRLIDGHGRTTGARLVATAADRHATTRVRRVDRQGEDLHSRISRMLKACHRQMLREA